MWFAKESAKVLSEACLSRFKALLFSVTLVFIDLVTFAKTMDYFYNLVDLRQSNSTCCLVFTVLNKSKCTERAFESDVFTQNTLSTILDLK